MKLIQWVIFSFAVSFSFSAAAQSSAENAKVADYLQKGFGFSYSPINDRMKCSDSISTPQKGLWSDRGAKVYANCIAESVEGYTAMIGWYPIKNEAKKALERAGLQKDFAGEHIRRRMRANPAEKLIASNPFNCNLLSKEAKGDLVECSLIPLKIEEREIPFNFYVFYFVPSSDSKEIFLLVSDDFKKQPIKEIILDYVSRISYPDISAGTIDPVVAR